MYDSKQLESFRYAQMQSSIMNKTSLTQQSTSGGKVNLNTKFAHLKETLDQMQAQLHQLSNETKESMRYASQLKTDLVDRELSDQKNKLNEELKKLQKTVKYGVTQSQKRSQKIWQHCTQRIALTEQLKSKMAELRHRISRLENTLGYYPVMDKVL